MKKCSVKWDDMRLPEARRGCGHVTGAKFHRCALEPDHAAKNHKCACGAKSQFAKAW